MNVLSKMYYQILLSQLTRVKWPFAGCFLKAQWRAVRVVWSLDGALANQEMAVCGCVWLYSPVVLDNDLCCKYPFILASSEP